jgi:prepilin-type N-terminal cleavage/methylation domain-containing protein
MKFTTFFKKQLKAFSLLEVAISLSIIGVLTLAVIKGQSLLYQARMDKTTSQIEAVKISIETFRSTYGQLPGDYNGTELRASKIGNGDGLIENNETETFWEHLEKAGLLTKKQSVPAVGGVFSIALNPATDLRGNWLKLSNADGSGIMNTKDAIIFKIKVDGSSDNASGSMRIRGGNGQENMIESNGNLKDTKQKAFIFYIEFP